MVHGYQLAVYLDKPTARIQIILAALAADNNWKLCADGMLMSKFKVSVRNPFLCLSLTLTFFIQHNQ